MLNCCVNERNVLEGRLASAHGPRTELFLKSFPSKLQCSQLTVSLSCVQLCLSAAPLILLLFSILNETSSDLICSIKRAGREGFFSCKWRCSLFDFFSRPRLKLLFIPYLFHWTPAVLYGFFHTPTLQMLLFHLPERHRPKVESAFRDGPNQCGDGKKEIAHRLGTKRRDDGWMVGDVLHW